MIGVKKKNRKLVGYSRLPIHEPRLFLSKSKNVDSRPSNSYLDFIIIIFFHSLYDNIIEIECILSVDSTF